jgi:tetratricopeptide (TPR) repeat protein
MGKNDEKYTVSLVAKVKQFVKNMGQATKAMKMVGDMNRGIIKNLQNMSSAATKAGGMFNQTQQKMRNGVTETEKATNKGTKSWKKYFKALAAGGLIVGALGTALLAAHRLLKRARIGAAIQVQAKAFANLAASHGANAKKMMVDLREASKGTIDNLQIMTTASRAIMLGIAPEKLTNLMRIARASAKAMGTTVAGAFSDIALGIGRQSRLILDNLGIIVRVKAAYDRYAFSIGTTAEALTDFEKAQAFAGEVERFGEKTLANRGKDLLDFQDKLAQVDTVMKNVSQTVNLQLSAAFVNFYDILERKGIMTNLLAIISESLPEAIGFMVSMLITFMGIAEKTMDAVVNKLKEGIQVSGKLVTLLTVMLKAASTLPFLLSKIIPGMGLIQKAIDAPIMAIDELNKALANLTKVMNGQEAEAGTWLAAVQNVLKEYREGAKNLGKIWKENLTPDSTPLEIATRKLKSFNEEFEDGLTSSKDLLNTWTQLSSPIKAAAREVGRLLSNNEALPEGIKAYEEALKVAESRLEKIRDNVMLVELEVPSTEEFNKTVRRALAKMDRALKSGLLKTREEKSLVFEKLFAGVFDRSGGLEPDVKASFMALLKEFGKLTDIAETLPDSFGKGLDQWLDKYRDANNRLSTMGVQTAQAISKGFEDFFFNSVTGKLKSLRETFANFGTSILRSVSKALGDKATQEILLIAGFKGNQAVEAQNENTQAVRQNTAALLGGKLGIGGGTKFTSLGDESEALLKLSQGHPGFGVLKDSGVEEKVAKTMDQKATSVTNSILDKVKKSMNDVFHKFTGFMGGLFRGVTGLFSGGAGGGGALSGVGGLLGRIGGGISKAFGSGGSLGGIGSFLGKIWPFAEGGITSLSGALDGAMMTSRPSLAAISETGKREAIVPLEKFAELIQQPNININAIDTKSFQQYINDNKELLYGAINSIRSPQNQGTMASGPY